MSEFFDKLLQLFIDTYICNSVGILSVMILMGFTVIEGQLTYCYFKKSNAPAKSIKIYSLLFYRLIVLISVISFKWWLALILSLSAIIIAGKFEKYLYTLQPEKESSEAATGIKIKMYILTDILYFCIGLIFNSIIHDDIFWLVSNG